MEISLLLFAIAFSVSVLRHQYMWIFFLTLNMHIQFLLYTEIICDVLIRLVLK